MIFFRVFVKDLRFFTLDSRESSDKNFIIFKNRNSDLWRFYGTNLGFCLDCHAKSAIRLAMTAFCFLDYPDFANRKISQ